MSEETFGVDGAQWGKMVKVQSIFIVPYWEIGLQPGSSKNTQNT